MLILTRRVGESLMIGDEVTVAVLGIKSNQVRIGVDAPKTTAVHREEIFARVQQEKAAVGPFLIMGDGRYSEQRNDLPAALELAMKLSTERRDYEVVYVSDLREIVIAAFRAGVRVP